MKTKTLAIGYLLVILTLLGVGIVVTQMQAPISATVRITPPMWSLEDPAPAEFRLTIKLSGSYKPEEINGTTILVGGLVPMKAVPDWPKITKNFFAFKVDGPSLVYWVILPQIWHMGVPGGAKVDVPIKVTGLLNDGVTAFEGTCEITVMTEHASPPPPPL